MTTVELTGLTFSRLTVIGRSQKKTKAGALWDCACVCGGAATVLSLKLRNGHTQSCGCLQRERTSNSRLTHGHSKQKTRTYRTWKEMRQRCSNSNSDKWKWYGARGISVAPEWDDFTVFLSDMGLRPEGKTLDRIDPDRGYSKSNCRWATPKEQAETNRGVFKKGIIPWNFGGLRTFEKSRNVHAK